jgi:hypothetical protein
MFRTYRQLPPIQTGYPLDDVWSVVVPVARTNLVTNPSFETGTTAWTAIGGSIARTTTQQYHGAYSLAITPTAATTDGARFDTVSLTSGTTYAYSAKVRGVAGLKYKLAIETTGAVELNAVTFTATGRWQWVSGYYTETSTTTRRLTVRKAAHVSVALFYTDGAQVEAIASGETVSTYIDGDQLGLVPNQLPVAYYWTGTPHGSTSTRSAQTRAGGMVVPLKRYNFLLTAIIGLGMAGVQNVSTDYARIDGSYDDYTRKPARQFTLTGRFQGRTYAELRRNRSGLAQLFDRDLTGQDQRLTLLRTVEDGYGRVTSTTVRSLSKYESGFSGNTDNQHAETVPITFTQYLPGIQADGESGAALNVQSSVSNMNYLSRRAPDGTWSAMGTGGAGGSTVGTQALAIGLDGKVYAGGSWTSVNAVANTSKIAYWDPVALTWNAMGTGATGGDVYAIFVAADGSVYAAGDFTAMGGVANTTRIAKWNGSAWSSVTGASTSNGAVYAIAQAKDGNFYIGGDFTSIGGTAANRIVKWNGVSTWTAMGTGSVTTLVVGPNATDIYAGGNFTSMGGVANTGHIARWSTTTGAWNALGTGIPTAGSEFVADLAFGANNILYVAGQFATAGGVSADNIATWNGVAFTPLSTGFIYSPSTVNEQSSALLVLPNGQVYIGGLFDQAGPITLPDSMAIWTGGGFTSVDIDLNGGALVSAWARGPDGTLYVGHNSTGTATAASTTTLTNTGTARTFPTVTIKGPSSGTARIYSIINATTNRAIYLNLTMNAGETARLILQPDNLSFTSDFQGNIASSILGGSNEADFFLQPGANSIAFLSSGSTVTATVNWRPAYASLDDVP